MREQEQTLNRIKSLRRDLVSELVIQEESGHEEYAVEETGSGHGMTTWDYAAGDSWVPRKYVVDRVRIAILDEEKRSAARQELQTIYEATMSFRVKYNAGRALGRSSAKILFDRLRGK